MCIITLIGYDLPDNTAADERGFGCGEQKNGFDPGQFSVGMGNGFFEFKISRISKSPNDKISLYFFTKFNGQPFILTY